jgi:hypothetical protein
VTDHLGRTQRLNLPFGIPSENFTSQAFQRTVQEDTIRLPRFESSNGRITVGENAYTKMLLMPTGNQPIAKANWETPTNSKSAGKRMSVIDTGVLMHQVPAV